MNKWESTYGQQMFSVFRNSTPAMLNIFKFYFLQNKICYRLGDFISYIHFHGAKDCQ